MVTAILDQMREELSHQQEARLLRESIKLIDTVYQINMDQLHLNPAHMTDMEVLEIKLLHIIDMELLEV